MRRPSRNFPFTLLEILLAVSVLLVLTTLSFGVFFSIPRGYGEQRLLARRLEELAALDRIADFAVRNAVPFHWRDEHNVRRPVFFGGPRLTIFAFRTRSGENSGGIRFLALGVRDGALIAQYRDEPILHWAKEPLPETLREEVILTDVEEIEFLYAGWKEGKPEWHTEWDEKENPELPRAIGWKIRFTDGRTVSYLRRTAGNSYYTNWGKRNDFVR